MHMYLKLNKFLFKIQILKFIIVCFFLIICGISAMSQKKETIYQCVSDYKGYSIFYISKHVPEIKFNPNLDYYWSIENEIHITKGAFGGKPLHGNFLSYYLDNNLKEKGCFFYGLKNNEWNYWFPNGNLQKTENYKLGLLEGIYKIYNDRNQIIITGEYKGNKKNGVWKLYNNNGKIMNEFTWEKGILNGKFIIYDSLLTSKGNYKNGNLHRKYTIYKDNKIDTVICYNNGKIIPPKPNVVTNKKTNDKTTNEKGNKNKKSKKSILNVFKKKKKENLLDKNKSSQLL